MLVSAEWILHVQEMNKINTITQSLVYVDIGESIQVRLMVVGTIFSGDNLIVETNTIIMLLGGSRFRNLHLISEATRNLE